MIRARHPAAVAAGVIAAIVAGYLVLRVADRDLAGVELGDGAAPPFTLEAASRGAVTLGSFQGHVLLLTFGPTCPGDACRSALRTIDQALDRLGERRRDVRVAFVTTDPEDRLDELRAFVQDVDLGIAGLGGDSASLTRASADYRAAVPDSVWSGSGIFGIDRTGRLRVYWGPDTDANVLARDIRRLLRSRGSG